MRVAVISDIHANLHALEAVARGDRRARSRTRSGASATSSATGRSRTSAATVVARRAPTSASSATTTSACSGRSTSRTFSPTTRPRPRAGRGRARPTTRARSSRRSSRARGATGVALYHGEPARPGLGVRAQRRRPRATRSSESPAASCSSATATCRSRSADGASWLGGPAPDGTEVDLDAAAGCSTPARSASRATATRDAAWLLLDLDGAARVVPPRGYRSSDAGGDPRAPVCPSRSRSGCARRVSASATAR